MAVAPALGAARRRLVARRSGWTSLALAGVLAAYLLALASTHAALAPLSGGWSGTLPGERPGLAPINASEQALVGPTPGYLAVLWANRPGGEVTVGFRLRNGGLIPVTLQAIRVGGPGPKVISNFAAAGTLLGPNRTGGMAPFHPVTLGPGGVVGVGLTVRVVCDPVIRQDVLRYNAGSSIAGGSTNPVLVRYRALGITMEQTITLSGPVLLVMRYAACG